MSPDFFTKPTARAAGTAEPRQSSAGLQPTAQGALQLQGSARSLLRALGFKTLAERVVVVWNSRMRSTAGTAIVAKNLISLNPRLLAFGLVEVERTLKHELAHLLAQHRAGRRRIAAHGVEWQKACVELGLPNEKRCHDLPLPRREVQKRYTYKCPHCGLEVPRVQPLRRKSACMSCCRAYSKGHYDERFRLIKQLPST